MAMRKGLSETIGFIILLMILIVALVPLATIIFSQPSVQQQQIENAQPYKNLALQQYQDFASGKLSSISNSSLPPVEFLYKCNGYVIFALTTTQPPPIPLEIMYLEVYNGTQWVILQIEKEGNMYVAVPTNKIPTSGIAVVPNDTNAYYDGYPAILIKLPLSAIPYHNHAQYVKVVTQYGDTVTATSAMPDCYVFEGEIYPYNVRYYNSTTAYIDYWAGINNQPVLQLVPAQQGAWGAVFWNQYYNGGNITISFIGTYTEIINGLADGFQIFLFMKPTQWNVSVLWNESTDFPWSANTTLAFGANLLPQSSIPYILVHWDPIVVGLGGEWEAAVINNSVVVSHPFNNYTRVYFANYPYPNGNNDNKVGTNGTFLPYPGDYILFTVTYDPTTNIITAIARDINISAEAMITAKLPTTFQRPSPGWYVFGIGADNGGGGANWGLIYVNVPSLESLFNPYLATLLDIQPNSQYIYNGYTVYYNSIEATQFWNLAGISSNIPVLQIAPAYGINNYYGGPGAGAVFWNQSYIAGQNLTIKFITTYTYGSNPPGDGVVVFLFMKPTEWSITPPYNHTWTPAWVVTNTTWFWQGPVLYPESAIPYIMVQWDPYFKDWYVAIVNTSGEHPTWTPFGYGPDYDYNHPPQIYNFTIIPANGVTVSPGDYIMITITFDPGKDEITGIIENLNTSKIATMSFQLPSNYTLPNTGTYAFGIEGVMHAPWLWGSLGGYANWGLLYVNVPSLEPLFSGVFIKYIFS